MLTSIDLQKLKNKHFSQKLAEEQNIILEGVFYLDETPTRVMFNVINAGNVVAKTWTLENAVIRFNQELVKNNGH